jgi:hypothetical protein
VPVHDELDSHPVVVHDVVAVQDAVHRLRPEAGPGSPSDRSRDRQGGYPRVPSGRATTSPTSWR